ncbi:MAG: secretin N-terminal domain-containing protein [Planctomycetota bacterium]
MPEIADVVDELNRQELYGEEGREIRIFPLRVARAQELARTIDEMYPPPPVPRDRRGRPLYHLQLPREVVVRADDQTNALIVDAPIKRMAGFDKLVEQLDRQQIIAESEVRTYRVIHADLNALRATLQQLSTTGGLSPAGRDRRIPISINVEPVSRSLVVSGPSDIFDRVEQVLGDLDAKRAAPATSLRFFKLANARAESLVPMLREILLRRLAEDVEQAGPDAAELLNISADRKTNTLIISAPPEIMPVADALIAELDHPRAAVEAVDVRIFQLTQADAAQVAGAVRQAVDARARADGEPLEATIAPEPSSNSIVVTAPPMEVARIEALIESLDGAPPADKMQVRTVFLKHARAERLAPLIGELLAREDLLDVDRLPYWQRMPFVQMQMRQGGPEPTVRVAADTRLNAIVISAPLALLNVAEQMVAQLDVDPADVGAAGQRSVRVLVVDNADAAQLAGSLEAIFAEDAEAPPTIRVDPASNSLLVVATDAQYQTIENVVREIDRATITTSRQMRMIPLDPSKASARELARTLQRIMGRRGGGGVQIITVDELLDRRQTREKRKRGPTSALPLHLRDAIVATAFAGMEDEQAAAEDDGADPNRGGEDPEEGGGVTIAVDPDTNSLIIVGSPRSIERVADLARQLLDQIPAAPGRIRYIGLPEGVDARTTATLIAQTISQMTPPGGRRGDLRRRVAVIADQANNALIVTCNESDFEIVGDLVAALSQPSTTEQIVVKVYALETITADRAAESVRRMLEPGPARAPRRGRQAQRMRDLAVKLLVDDQAIEAVFDPGRVRVSSDPQNNALIVMGPPEAIGFVDEFIELLDQTPVNVQTTLKLYPLQHAQASDLRNMLRNIFRVRFQSLRRMPGASAIQPEFAFDDRTNTLLVTAAPEQLAEVDALLEELDRGLGEDRQPLRTIELSAIRPQQAATILEKVVIGSDQKRRSSTLIVADDSSGVLLVRAPEDVMDEIDEVLAEIDRRSTREFKIRTIVLKAANPDVVARALQQLYDDRARIASAGRGRREQSRRVSIVGDRDSNMLLVAASDEDFAGIQELVAKFDSPEASQALGFRVFQLKHAKATEIADTVQDLAWQIMFSEEGPGAFWWGGRGQQRERSRSGVLAVEADSRLNALIVTGEGDKFEVVARLIEVLDAPEPEGERRTVKLYRLEHANVDVVADVLNETFAFGSRYRRWWQEPDPTEVRIRTDRRNKIIIVYGTARQQEEIGAFIKGIDEQTATGDQEFAVLPVEFAQARELARTLNQFLVNRAQVTGAPAPTATIVASQSANTLIVSAAADELATIRDLLSRIDQPSVSGDRAIEIVVLAEGNAEEIARIVREQFGRRGGTGVIVTPDARTNSIIINAPRLQFEQARALIERLDAPPDSDETIIRTYALEGARADEVVRILGETLQLDERGETTGITIRLEGDEGPAVEVKAKIVADRRSNSVIVTATEESFPVIETLIAGIDEVPAVSPIEYRIIPLAHALAPDVSWTLSSFLRQRARDPGEPQPRIDYNRIENQLIIAATADQFEQIERIVAELDQPSRKARVTDFVPLRFAQAEQVQEALSVFYGPMAFEADTPGKSNARIVADPATNSLVITADETEWEDIRALLAKLDNEEYDVSLQLKVIPLMYADARSVAQAINNAFSTELQRGRRQPSERGARRSAREPERRGEGEYPTVLVEAEDWVRASAEPLTNSVIVSASRMNISKIEQIVTQLDVADYAKLPPPQIIPVRSGSPQQLAESLRRLYEQAGDNRGRKALRIVGDDTSNTIVVRAEAEDFRQIQALAEALQDEASEQGLSVYVLKLRATPARRVADAIRQAFSAKAQQAGQPLSVQVDVQGNSLVIACTAALFDEIRDTIEQLDELAPAAGQGIFIIELEHVSPDAAKRVIETIGLHRPPRDDSVSRIVTEPIKVVPLSGRNAIIVIANPVDRDIIVGLLKAIDSEPELAEARVRVIKLRNAQAQAVAGILSQLLVPGRQQAGTPLANAVREQVRRLSVRRDGLGDGDVTLDLTKPVRVIADPALNALIIASTPANVDVLVEIVALFDELPITDGVTVQLFPLANIAADQFARIVRELFAQGKRLGAVPGTNLEAVPGGMAGRALLDEVAISVDERTNTVIVAGKQDAVALVEVLYRRIDSDVATGWVEPRIVQLRFADAQDLAETLNAILVEGATNRAP